MRQRILILFLMILLGVFITQGTGLFPGIQNVSAIDSDYYSPYDLAYSPDGTMIAVSDLTKARLNIITASTGSIARTIQLTGKPKGVAWNGNTRVYVAEYGAGTVAEIDPSNGSILRRFSTGRMPVGLAVASNKLAVTDFGLKQVTVVDLTTGNNLGSVTVKDYPYFVDMTTNGTYAVVGHAIPSGNAWSTGYAASVSFVDMNTRTRHYESYPADGFHQCQGYQVFTRWTLGLCCTYAGQGNFTDDPNHQRMGQYGCAYNYQCIHPEYLYHGAPGYFI